MTDTINRLLERVIDYAGLFPPANLDLDTAWKNYRKHLKSENSWMLSHFISPVARLADLRGILSNDQTHESQITIAALMSFQENPEDYFPGLINDLVMINDLINSQPENSLVIDVLEQAIPRLTIDQHTSMDIYDFIAKTDKILQDHYGLPVAFFWEIKDSADWAGSYEKLVREIDNFNRKHSSLSNNQVSNTYGVKIRCGGLDEKAYPPIEQVAAVINLCRIFDVPIKATAGLHHPIRHYNFENKVKMHGFLNLMTSIIFANKYNLNKEQIGEILSDEEANSFRFTDSLLKWKDYQVSVDQIREIRKTSFISFGSCSFEEPIEDLINLNLL